MWGGPPRAGALYGQRLRDYRLRRRADETPWCPTAQALAPPGRRWDAEILPLRLLRGPGRPDAGSASGRLRHPGAVGTFLVPRRERRLPEGLPRRGRPNHSAAADTGRVADPARRLPSRKGNLRGQLRAHLPTAVGPNPSYGNPGSPGIATKRSCLNGTCWNRL